jgi:isocitrate dehydrogenase
METFFRFIPDYSFDDDEILLFPITSENIQERSKVKLSDKQFYRIFLILCSFENTQELIKKAIDEAIDTALSENDEIIKEMDKQFKELRASEKIVLHKYNNNDL